MSEYQNNFFGGAKKKDNDNSSPKNLPIVKNLDDELDEDELDEDELDEDEKSLDDISNYENQDDLDEDELDEIKEKTNKISKKNKKEDSNRNNLEMDEENISLNEDIINEDEEYDDSVDDDDEENDENYLKKFDEKMKQNIITQYHPELNQHNYEEIDALSMVVRNSNGTIIDPLHRTIPFLTKYEKARILGDRARQINSGAKPFVEVEPFIMDGYLIALKEMEEKKIPFIIKRPLPNGGVEYWKLKDLEILV